MSKGLQYGRGHLTDHVAHGQAIDERRRDLSRQQKWIPTRAWTQSYSAKLNEMVRCDTTGGGFTVSLPSASAIDAGEMIGVKITHICIGNVVTVLPVTGQTIDGNDSYGVTGSYASLTFESDGGNWMVV